MARPRIFDDAHVLRATGNVLLAKGPAGLTLRAVGAAAGVASSTLIQRFGSKRGLLLAFARSQVVVPQAVFEAAMDAHAAPLDVLVEALVTLAKPFGSKEALAQGLSFLQSDMVNFELRTVAMEQFEDVAFRIEDQLSRAYLAGALRKRTKIKRLTRTIQATWNGAIITWGMLSRGSLDRWLRAHMLAVLEPHLAAAQLPARLR